MKNIRCTAFLKAQRASIDKFFLGAAVNRNIYQLKGIGCWKKISFYLISETKCVEIIWRIRMQAGVRARTLHYHQTLWLFSETIVWGMIFFDPAVREEVWENLSSRPVVKLVRDQILQKNLLITWKNVEKITRKKKAENMSNTRSGNS